MVSALLLQFLAFVGGALALGQWFDRLSTNEQRAKVRSFLLAQRDNRNPSEKIMDFIRLVRASVFDRFFGARIFSWAYFRNCALLSTLFLLLIGTLQYLHDPAPFLEIAPSTAQIAVLAICFVANLLVDWVSIAQTQTFIEIAAGLQKPWQALLLIVSDLLVTINIFALLYAGAIAIPLFVIDSWPADVRLRAMSDTHPIPVANNYGDLRAFSDHASETSFALYLDYDGSDIDSRRYVGTIMVEDGWKPQPPQRVRPDCVGGFCSGPDFSDYSADYYYPAYDTYRWLPARSVFDASSAITGIKVTDSAQIGSAFSEDVVYDDSTPPPGTCLWTVLQPKPKALLCFTHWHLTERVGLRVGGTLSSAGIIHAFHEGYILAGANQYYLGDMLSLRAGTMNLGDVSLWQPAALIESDTYRACNRDGAVNSLKNDFGINPTICNHQIVVSKADLEWLTARVRAMGNSLSNCIVPVNTLFLTSLTMTALLYALSLLLITAKVLWVAVFSRIQALEPIIMRAPFSTASAVVGLIAFVISVLW